MRRSASLWAAAVNLKRRFEVVEIVLNGKPHQTGEDASVASLLAELDLAPQRVAVEVNYELVPRERHAEHRLKSGDQLEVVTLVGGG